MRLPYGGVENWHNANGRLTYMDITRPFGCQVEDEGRIIAIRVLSVVRLDPSDL